MSRPSGTGRRSAVVAAIYLAVVSGLLLGLFLLLFERTEEEVWRPPSAEVRSNPLVAARLFLREMGAEVSEQRGVGALPPDSGTFLLMMPDDTFLAEEEWAELESWTDRGGLLIVGPEPTVLAAFGLELEWIFDDDTSPGDASEEAPGEDVELEDAEEMGETFLPDEGADEAAGEEEGGGEDFYGRVEVEAPDRAGTFGVSMHGANHLVPADEEDAFFPYGEHLYVEDTAGGGRVVVVRDMAAFGNSLIGREDNAAFLLALIGDRLDQPVVLARPSVSATFLGRVLRRGWPAWAGALVLLAAWVWSRSRRFGPIEPDPEPGRRSLAEHLAASGEFLWRSGHHAGLLSAARDAVLARAAASQPGWEHLPWARRCERLARGTGLEAREVAEALHGSSPRAEDFVRHMWILEKVRLKQAR